MNEDERREATAQLLEATSLLLSAADALAAMRSALGSGDPLTGSLDAAESKIRDAIDAQDRVLAAMTGEGAGG